MSSHQRINKRPSHLSRDRIINKNDDDSSTDKEPTDHTKSFSANSIVHLTWGMPVSSPVKAVQRHRRARPRRRGPNNNTSEPSSDLPNGPDRSPFFQIPLEARELIYGYLLIHKLPIIVHSDWKSVQTNSPHSHTILKTCKQISEEGSRFLYRNNIFLAIVRGNYEWETEFLIDERWIKYFRSVIINCDKSWWSEDGLKQVAKSVAVLVNAETYLQSFTIIVQPQKVGLTETAIGMQSNAITFADFFWTGSKIMALIPRLQCKTFNIIMKIQGHKRVLISIDLRHLDQQENQRITLELRAEKAKQKKVEEQEKQEGAGVGRHAAAIEQIGEISMPQQAGRKHRPVTSLENDLVASATRRKLKNQDLRILKRLKRLFEEVFINHEKAIEEGKCRLLGEHEELRSAIGF